MEVLQNIPSAVNPGPSSDSRGPPLPIRFEVARLVREWPFGEADALVLVQGMQRKDEDALDVGEATVRPSDRRGLGWEGLLGR